MAHTELTNTYRIDLNDREFRLVCLGLAGMLKDPEDIEEGVKLNLKLCTQRVESTAKRLETFNIVLEKAKDMEQRLSRNLGEFNTVLEKAREDEKS
jgi:hypothetical protein